MNVEKITYNDGTLNVSFIKDSIVEVMQAGNDASKAFFKAYISNDKVDIKPIQLYAGTINDFLTSWTKFAEDFNKKINNVEVHDMDGIKGIKYSDIKEYIYADYDYVSILPVVDGIFRGVTDKTINNVDKLNDFMVHSIDKAFGGKVFNPASLIDDIISFFKDNYLPLDKAESAKFKSAKNQDMFNSSDKTDMIRAFTKVLEVLGKKLEAQEVEVVDLPLVANIINDIITYINYTLTVYEKRIVLIYLYAFPYISKDTTANEGTIPCCESTESILTDSELESTFVKEVDEMICRDPEKINDIVDKYNDILKSLGAKSEVTPTMRDTYSSWFYAIKDIIERKIQDGVITNNIFLQDLDANPVMEYFRYAPTYISISDIRNCDLRMFNRLKDLVYNHSIAIPTISSSYRDMLFVLRNKNLGNKTVEDIRTTATDLVTSVLFIASSISATISAAKEYMHLVQNVNANIGEFRSMTETLKLYNDIYREINIIALYRLKDLEAKANEVQNKIQQNILDELTIKVPGMKDDNSPDDNLMSAMADTSIVSAELPAMYAAPTMEAYELYDEFIREAYMGDYIEEAFDIGKIINNIIAAIIGMIDRIKSSLKNKKVQAAINWTKENRTKLLNANYEGTMKVVPYKKDINLSFARTLLDNIRNIDVDNIHYPEGRNDFLKTLYADDSLVKLFESDKDNKVKKQQYENFLIVGTPIPSGNEINVTPKEISGENIKTEIRIWIDNVSSADDIINEFDTFGKMAREALTALKTKVFGTKMEAVETNGSDGGSSSAENDETKEDKQNEQTSEEENNKEDASKKNTNVQIIADVDKAFANIIIPLGSAVRDCIIQQYDYIKQAYTLIRK